MDLHFFPFGRAVLLPSASQNVVCDVTKGTLPLKFVCPTLQILSPSKYEKPSTKQNEADCRKKKWYTFVWEVVNVGLSMFLSSLVIICREDASIFFFFDYNMLVMLISYCI